MSKVAPFPQIICKDEVKIPLLRFLLRDLVVSNQSLRNFIELYKFLVKAQKTPIMSLSDTKYYKIESSKRTLTTKPFR